MRERVAIVGAGKKLYSIYNIIYKKYDIVGVFDTFPADKVIEGQRVKNIEEIVQCNYDIVLITTLLYAVEIYHRLIKLGVKRDVIFPYMGENDDFDSGYLSFKNDRVLFNNSKYRVTIGKGEGYGGLSEILVGDAYNFNISDDCIVIDIGMNIGCATLYFASRENVKRVIGFEPLTRTFNIAKRNVSENTEKIRDKITIYNVGLGNQNCLKKVNYNSDNLTCFNANENIDNNGNDEVEIRRASEMIRPYLNICKEEGYKAVLKMDCEGDEYEIFDDLVKEGLFEDFEIIMVEYHKTDGKETENLLLEHGYSYFKFSEQKELGMIYAVKR